MAAPALEIKDFSFAIGRKRILKGVSLTVDEGEYLSIIGPNGAGKTTLLKCADGLLAGGTGTIQVLGRAVGSTPRKELARTISYVPQADGRVFPFTVYEFVMMGRYPHLSPFSSTGPEDEEAVREALELTHTTDFTERALDSLSGGERQKVFIAAALVQGARILLLDEPTTFLDPRHQDEIHLILKRLNRTSNVTIVSVTHDINSAVMSSNRVAALKEGEVFFSGPAGDVMDNRVLEGLYGKRFTFVTHPATGRPVIVPDSPGRAGAGGAA